MSNQKEFESVGDYAMAGDPAFVPTISVRKDPSGGSRELWCWHLPKGFKEFHGIVRLIPLEISRREYAAALKTRFRIDVTPEQVTCDVPGLPATPPVVIEIPKVIMSSRIDEPRPVSMVMDPEPVESPCQLQGDKEENNLDLSPEKLDPLPLTVPEILPLAAAMVPGKELKVRVPKGTTMHMFQTSLRNTLNGSKLTREYRWGVRKFYQESGDDPDDIKNCLRVVILEEVVFAPSMRATERVEERVETRVTERSVTVTAPEKIQVGQTEEVISLPEPSNKITESRPLEPVSPNFPPIPPCARPVSYLPPDGEVAKRVLDLHEKLAGIDYDTLTGDYENTMEEIWEIQEGVKHYRDTKAIVDRLLIPWVEKHFRGLEGECGQAWTDLWKIMQDALLEQIHLGEKRLRMAVDKERKEQS